MARRSKAATPEPPDNNYHLKVRRAEAREKIEAAKAKGKELYDRADGIRNKEMLQAEQDTYYNWKDYCNELLTRLFSNDQVRNSFGGSIGVFVVAEQSLQEEITDHKRDIERAIRDLDSVIDRLDLIDSPMDEAGGATSPPPLELNEARVFIVHGHDEAARETVARAIEKLGLEAVILNEQANEGKTIIEKFEAHSAPGFAVVLLTPDDLGGKDEDSLVPRARQNVILELGFFMGKLGRNRVLALVKGGIEIPSDISGVVYEPMDDGGNWKLRLGKELRAAGIAVDMNLLV